MHRRTVVTDIEMATYVTGRTRKLINSAKKNTKKMFCQDTRHCILKHNRNNIKH